MKPSELRRELKMRYHDWKTSQHGAIENVSGDETRKQDTTVRLVQLHNHEIAQLHLIVLAVAELENHLRSQIELLELKD